MAITKAPTAIICLSPGNGGMEMNAIKLARKLSPHTKITVIAKENHFIANNHKDYVGFNGIKLETIKFKRNFGPSLIKNAKQIVLKHGIKNVIFFGASELKSLHFAFKKLDINLTVIHSTTKAHPKKDWFHKIVYKDVNTHVSICQHLKKNVRYIVPFGKDTTEKMIYTSLVVNPIEHQSQKKLTIVHSGRIARGKGQVDAIQAVKALVDNNIDFDFYLLGALDEKYKPEFDNFLKTIDYQKHLHFIGFTKEVPTYLAMADIFLFPSWGEGLSNAFVEALAANIPCLSYDNTSFPELQELGFHFHIAKDRDITDLQEKLLTMATNIDEEKSLCKKNYTIAKETFAEAKEVESYLELLI